jgi:valyl-tRNA synthetase
LRGLFNIAPSLKLPVVVNCTTAEPETLFSSQFEIIRAMTRAQELVIGVATSKPDGSAITVLAGTEIYVQVKDVIDPAKERERLQKEAERLLKMAQTTEAKLANEKFVAGAPADVVQYERAKLASFRDNHAKIMANVALLG